MLPRRSVRLHQRNSQTDSILTQVGHVAVKRIYTCIVDADPTDNDVAILPKQKKMKLDNEEDDSLASISLLESLPSEILAEIFVRTDDVGFFNLANTCTRFEAIALDVASMRYSDRYFVINGNCLGGDPEMYAAQFNRFGKSINAIEVNHIKDIDSNHWLANILHNHISHITKLTFSDCTFYLKQENNFLLPMENITHFVSHNVSFGRYSRHNFDFSNCRKLIKLDIRKSYFLHVETLKEIIRNNPTLHSIIHDYFHLRSHEENSIMDHLKQVKKLGVVEFIGFDVQPDAMDPIISVLKNLESMVLDVRPKMIELLQRLGFECKQIKHLELILHDYYLQSNIQTEFTEAIRSFDQVESLNWINIQGNTEKIESTLKHLPNLRQLRIEILNCEHLFSNLSSLLRECPSLERITVALVYMDEFVSVQFFKEFIETIIITGKSNARIEFEQRGKIVGSVTEPGIVWRNKLMHWTDSEKNDTNIHLLDLANQREESVVGRGSCTEKEGPDAVQRNLLDRIFDYLDMQSLHFLAETSPRSEQLVENYIEMHTKRNGTFTMTNEFFPFKRSNKMHKMFAPHVTDLKVYNFHHNSHSHRNICSGYKQLTEVSIYDENLSTKWNLPQSVRHLVFDGTFFMDDFEFRAVYSKWSNVEVLEFKKAGIFNDIKSIRKDAFKLRSLKEFIFNYRSETQIENLKKIFKGKITQLVAKYPN